MKKIIISAFLITLFLSSAPSFSNDYKNTPSRPNPKEINRMIEKRLDLTNEQKEEIKNALQENRKEMKKIIKRMIFLHDKIKTVYQTESSKYQAHIKTAPYKAELVILKQRADILRNENRKTFENLLNKEQKTEFEKIKQEMRQNKPHHLKN